MFRNTSTGYGWLAILVHWVFAIAFIGLFALGLYMSDLTYYDAYYQTAPHIHESIGILLVFLLVARFAWRLWDTHPEPEPGLKPYEIKGAAIVHWALYLLPMAIMISGYLITTADGSAISVFGWFEVPALLPAEKGREDVAGEVHEFLAFLAIGIVVLHTAAALKHHFVDRDRTFIRMVRPAGATDNN